MSTLKDYRFRELSSFGGAWLLKDASMVDVRGALLAQNVEYSAGQVGTRHGVVLLSDFATTGAVALTNWLAPFSSISSNYVDNAIVIVSTTGGHAHLYVYDLNTTTAGGLLYHLDFAGMTPGGATSIGVGMRLYTALFDTKQKSLNIGGVVTLRSNAGAVASDGGGFDNLFGGPVNYTPTVSEPAAGLITAGTHRLGYLVEYSNGFTTRVSPDGSTLTQIPSLTTFQPISYPAAGAKNLRLTFANNWNSSVVRVMGEMLAVSVVMTTVTNLNQYYIVPGSRTLLPAVGSTTGFTVDVSIGDSDLSSQGIDATPYLYWLTSSSNSLGASFQARHIALWGDRMAYLGTQTDSRGNAIDCIYASERNNYQSITADQHVIQLPGQKTITTMFRLGGGNYICGPHEISATSDNGDVPVTWAAPRQVDGRRGTLAIHGVEVAPSGDRAWIADQAGLFLFTGGPLLELPVSYYQSSDWARINWGSAYCVQIKDDAGTKRVRVLAPLDGATQPTHILTWDYTDGTSPEEVKYSLDAFGSNSFATTMELVRNDLLAQAQGNAGRIELWFAFRSASFLARQKSDLDTTPFRDFGVTGISSTYRTAPFPGRDQGGGVIQMHHGFHARIKGAGTITPKVYDIDAATSFTCRTHTLATAPDQDELFLADLRNELAFVEFATNTVDTHWTLCSLRWYHSPWIMQR